MSDTTMTLAEKLDKLADLESGREVLTLRKKQEIDQAVPLEILEKLNAIDNKYEAEDAKLLEEMQALETEIRAEVLARGETAKGSFLMATWNKGRISWDGKKLDGMMALIPQLKEARKEGAPTVNLRRVES